MTTSEPQLTAPRAKPSLDEADRDFRMWEQELNDPNRPSPHAPDRGYPEFLDPNKPAQLARPLVDITKDLSSTHTSRATTPAKLTNPTFDATRDNSAALTARGTVPAEIPKSQTYTNPNRDIAPALTIGTRDLSRVFLKEPKHYVNPNVEAVAPQLIDPLFEVDICTKSTNALEPVPGSEGFRQHLRRPEQAAQSTLDEVFSPYAPRRVPALVTSPKVGARETIDGTHRRIDTTLAQLLGIGDMSKFQQVGEANLNALHQAGRLQQVTPQTQSVDL